MRMTKQRTIILQELQKSCQHLSADVLYDRVRKILPRISLATVYRNLDTLAQDGMIKQLEAEGNRKIFDADIRPHNHIFCVQCQGVENIDLGDMSGLANLAGISDIVSLDSLMNVENCDYDITGYRINVLGICKECSDDDIKN